MGIRDKDQAGTGTRLLTVDSLGNHGNAEFVPGVPLWKSFPFTYADLAQASLTPSAVIYTLPAGYAVRGLKLYISESFRGGAISAYRIACGVSGAPELFSAYWDAYGTVNAALIQLVVPLSYAYSQSASQQILLTGDVDALANTATQGIGKLWLELIDLS